MTTENQEIAKEVEAEVVNEPTDFFKMLSGMQGPLPEVRSIFDDVPEASKYITLYTDRNTVQYHSVQDFKFDKQTSQIAFQYVSVATGVVCNARMYVGPFWGITFA